MKTLSLKNKLLQRLKEYGGWVHKARIEEKAKEWGFMAENGTRRMRELVEEGFAEQKEENGSALYRYKPQERVITIPEYIDNQTVIMKQKTIYD